MMRPQKDSAQRKLLARMLDQLKEGIIIVEGKHDVETLRRLGIDSISFTQFIGGNIWTRTFQSNKMFYIWMDADRGGDDKEQKVVALIEAMDGDIKYNVKLGKRLLKILGITSVEQAYGMIEQMLAA